MKPGRLEVSSSGAGVSSAGNTRGLIEASRGCSGSSRTHRSSAGNTRGLIEAAPPRAARCAPPPSLPRGIPAASLKPGARVGHVENPVSLPRGIPAASLKPSCSPPAAQRERRLPRGIPAASLKPEAAGNRVAALKLSSAGNTRGLIEAKKRTASSLQTRRVFRGEYPRPH